MNFIYLKSWGKPISNIKMLGGFVCLFPIHNYNKADKVSLSTDLGCVSEGHYSSYRKLSFFMLPPQTFHQFAHELTNRDTLVFNTFSE